jgi:DNA-binding NtrC family response regulator
VSRILLVEDDADVRLAVEHVLLDEGYEVDAAENCQQGRAFLDTQPYDLLLTDGRLPDGTGIELANVAAHDGVPALIITGYAFILRALVPDLSRYRVLLKPLRPAEIVEAVAGVLSEAMKH